MHFNFLQVVVYVCFVPLGFLLLCSHLDSCVVLLHVLSTPWWILQRSGLRFPRAAFVTAVLMAALLLPQIGLVLQWRPFCSKKQEAPWGEEAAPLHWPPDKRDWWPPTLRMETHRPFLLFDLSNFDLHYRCQAGRQGKSSALPSSLDHMDLKPL